MMTKNVNIKVTMKQTEEGVDALLNQLEFQSGRSAHINCLQQTKHFDE